MSRASFSVKNYPFNTYIPDIIKYFWNEYLPMKQAGSKNAEKLKEYFRGLDGAAIAFSGGVDSSVLAKTAHDVLGGNAVALTVDSPAVDGKELEDAKELAKSIGIRHLVIKHDELKNPRFARNEPDRCYHCKKEMLAALKKAAAEQGINTIIEGTNAEEILGHRPGYKAVKEANVCSPLSELGLQKKDIREIAAYLKLPNAKKPSMACLSSRIPYGTRITKELLDRVSKAEAVVREEAAGVKQLRVRSIGELAVIEVSPDDFQKIIKNGSAISCRLKDLGYKRAVLDLDGYSTGSMSI
jgi:uncharacterized protein